MVERLEQIQILFQKRNARKRGPTSSDEYNDSIEEIAHDFNSFNDQWNNRLVPLANQIPDGTEGLVASAVDAFTSGLDGATLFVNSRSTISLDSQYFNGPSERPRTVFEQFQNVYTSITLLEENLQNEISNQLLTADQIAIVDASSLFSSVHVEGALNEIKVQIDNLVGLSFSFVPENILPSIDNAFNLGSSLKRWNDLYLGPASLHIGSKITDPGGPPVKEFIFEIDSTTGELVIKDSAVEIMRMDSTGASFAVGLTGLVWPLEAEVAGTAGLPSYSFLGDINTGIFRPLADTLAFSTGGVPRFEINPSGNIGIGTIAGNPRVLISEGIYGGTPNSQFDTLVVESSAPTTGITIGSTGTGAICFADVLDPFAGGITYNHTIDSLEFKVQGISRMFTSVSGVGITGAHDLGSNLHIKNGDSGVGSVTYGELVIESSSVTPGMSIVGIANNIGRVAFGDNVSASSGILSYDNQFDRMGMTTNGTERITIDSTKINSNVPFQGLDGDSTNPAYSFANSPGTGMYHISPNKLYLKATSGLTVVNSATFLANCSVSGKLRSSAGTESAPSITFTLDADTGFYNNTANEITVSTGATSRFVFSGNLFSSILSSGASIANEAASDTNPTLMPDKLYLGTGIGSGAANELSLITNNLERIRIDSSGNVGIGTSSPSPSKLVLSDGAYGGTPLTAYDSLLIQDNGGLAGITIGAVNFGALWFADVNSGQAGGLFYQHSVDTMNIYAGGTPKITISALGAGFGNIAPFNAITVVGDGTIALKEQASAPGLTATYGKVYVKSSDGLPYYKDDVGTELTVSIRPEYLQVGRTADATIFPSTLHNIFGTTGTGGNVSVFTSSGITYNILTGVATIATTGIYEIIVVGVFSMTSGLLSAYNIEVNGFVSYNAQYYINGSDDPTGFTISLIKNLVAGDTVEANADGANAVTNNLGSLFSIKRIF